MYFTVYLGRCWYSWSYRRQINYMVRLEFFKTKMRPWAFSAKFFLAVSTVFYGFGILAFFCTWITEIGCWPLDVASKDVKHSTLLSDTLKELDHMSETLDKLVSNREDNGKVLQKTETSIFHLSNKTPNVIIHLSLSLFRLIFLFDRCKFSDELLFKFVWCLVWKMKNKNWNSIKIIRQIISCLWFYVSK
jgi:hypothetical protein